MHWLETGRHEKPGSWVLWRRAGVSTPVAPAHADLSRLTLCAHSLALVSCHGYVCQTQPPAWREMWAPVQSMVPLGQAPGGGGDAESQSWTQRPFACWVSVPSSSLSERLTTRVSPGQAPTLHRW